jgi:hypothetical protein
MSIAASGSALMMAVFSAFAVSANDSVRAVHAGGAAIADALSPGDTA